MQEVDYSIDILNPLSDLFNESIHIISGHYPNYPLQEVIHFSPESLAARVTYLLPTNNIPIIFVHSAGSVKAALWKSYGYLAEQTPSNNDLDPFLIPNRNAFQTIKIPIRAVAQISLMSEADDLKVARAVYAAQGGEYQNYLSLVGPNLSHIFFREAVKYCRVDNLAANLIYLQDNKFN